MLASVLHQPASEPVRVQESPVSQSSSIPQGHAHHTLGFFSFQDLETHPPPNTPPTHVFYILLLWAFFFTQGIHGFILIVNISRIFQREYGSSSLTSLSFFPFLPLGGKNSLPCLLPVPFLCIFWPMSLYRHMSSLPPSPLE